MRRDVLELDCSLTNMLDDFEACLLDVEAIRLMLSGGSVVDWQRLAFESYTDVDHFLRLNLMDVNSGEDLERLRYVYNEAVSYLEEHLKLTLPKHMRNPADVRDVFLWASEPGVFRRTQILSCVILKLIHVMNHLEASDLRFNTKISEKQLFDIARARILELGRIMHDTGMPLVSFNVSLKSRSSVITKLLAKKDTLAATIFDKLRFRIVVPASDNLVPTLAYLTRNFFPFNYVIPGQSHNNLLDPHLLFQHLKENQTIQPLTDEALQRESGKNEFSGSSYRMINVIVDFPVPVPPEHLGHFTLELGKVVFVMVEFQLLDEDTARLNEYGDNAHHLYKERQHRVVADRLKRGAVLRLGDGEIPD
jgi:uncharacterized protein (TIGR04552 family)